MSQIIYSFMKCGGSIYFFLYSANLIRISRSISESPLDFEITRVYCITVFIYVTNIFAVAVTTPECVSCSFKEMRPQSDNFVISEILRNIEAMARSCLYIGR